MLFFLLKGKIFLRTLGCMNIKSFAILGLIAALPLMGQDANSESENPQRGKRDAHRERLVKRFDKDGDGKLNDEERAAMQKFIEERRKNGARGGKERKRPSREEILKRYDKDEDGKLSEEERKEMKAEMGKHHRRGADKESDQSAEE